MVRAIDTHLNTIFSGWDTLQTSLVHAIAPLSNVQLNWRPAQALRSVGETAGHIALGRIDWFSRMPAPGSQALQEKSAAIRKPNGDMIDPAVQDASQLVAWLGLTWTMVEDTLNLWTVSDLYRTFRHTYWGKTYAVSYQWTIWRILSHDIQHGGQIAQMLGIQGIECGELGDLGGHLNEPPMVEQ